MNTAQIYQKATETEKDKVDRLTQEALTSARYKVEQEIKNIDRNAQLDNPLIAQLLIQLEIIKFELRALAANITYSGPKVGDRSGILLVESITIEKVMNLIKLGRYALNEEMKSLE